MILSMSCDDVSRREQEYVTFEKLPDEDILSHSQDSEGYEVFRKEDTPITTSRKKKAMALFIKEVKSS